MSHRSNKFVKDKNHNRYPAYCCDDIDARLGALEAAVEALVAQTVPDGSVTLAKLAADARTYTREINKGRLISEWIGTRAEYTAYRDSVMIDPNTRITITDDPAPAQVITEYYPDGQFELPVGALVIAHNSTNQGGFLRTAELYVVETLYAGSGIWAPYAFTDRTAAEQYADDTQGMMCKLEGTWRGCGSFTVTEGGSIQSIHTLFQRVE